MLTFIYKHAIILREGLKRSFFENMRKFVMYSWAIMATLAIVFVFTMFIRFTVVEGRKVTTYERFLTSKGFNAWSLVSPLQSEGVKTYEKKIVFDKKIIFPIAKKFTLTDSLAKDSSAEYQVALAIKRSVNDSLKSLEVEHLFDFDGTSEAVRVYQHQGELLPTYTTNISVRLHGTASPEATKYGFEESIRPGQLEQENNFLAQERVQKTANFIKSFGYKVDSISHEELQFATNKDLYKNLEAVTKDHSFLDSMRYV